MQAFDYVIIGGGLVGAGLALALKKANVKIALVDAKDLSKDDPRLLALNYSSCQFLQNLDIWPLLEPEAASIHQIHVSRSGSFGSIRLNRSDVKLDSLGYVIPAATIEQAFEQKLQQANNLTLFRPAKLINIEYVESEALLTLLIHDKEVTIRTKAIIGADGTASSVRQLANIEVETHDYQQSAIVTRTTLTRSHQSVAYERFTNDGAIAMLPLVGDECATIWTTTHQHAQQLLALGDQAFLVALQKNFGYRLGRLTQVSHRFVYPLKLVRAKTMSTPSILLLGNSAHTLHPIAAQGFNLALYEVAVLAGYVLQEKKEFCSIAELSKALQSAHQQQKISMDVTHGITKLFAEKNWWLKGKVLPLGLIAFDMVNPIKRQFMEKMMGRSGIVPRLLMSI